MEYPPPQTTTFSNNDAYVEATAYPNWDGSASECQATVPVTFTITWTGSGAAPDHVDIKSAKSVQVGRYLVYGSGGSGYGDSLGDPGGNDQNVENGIFNTTVTHSRSIRLPVSNGQATFTALMDITAFSPTTTHLPDYSDSVSVVCHDIVAIDNRDVDISSNFDPTFYRGTDSSGNPIRVQNVRSADGTMYGDTVEPESGLLNGMAVDYDANPMGSWGQNSQFSWYDSLTDSAGSGIFNPDPISWFDVTYNNPPASSGQADHIYLHLIDSQDGADATNNYYMRFHAPVENWKKQLTVNHPLPVGGPPPNATDTAPDWNNLGDWKGGIREDNNSSQTVTYSYALTNSVTDSVSGTIGGGVSIGLTQDEINAAFQINESITIGQSYTSSATQTVSYPIPPYTSLYLFWSGGWNECSGVCDIYGMDGYDGTTVWISHEPIVMPPGVLGISFAPSYYPIHQ